MTRKLRVIIEPVRTKMRDGKKLAADVIVVNDLKIPRPVLLVRTPYARDDTAAKLDALELARKGWAVIIQNVRGRYESQGWFNPFLQEYEDGYDTVEWSSRQSWSDGRVAMSGASYAGYTQWSCALAKPKALKAISPQITASDVRNGWFYEGEAFRQAFAQSWALSLAFTKPNNSPKLQKEIWNLADNLRDLYSVAPGKSSLTKLLPAYSEWININNHEYWNKLPILNEHCPVPLPSYHLTGWYDIFCEGSIRDFVIQQENSHDVRTNSIQRLVIGPWVHTPFLSQYAGEIDYGLQANGLLLNVMDEMHSWLRLALDKKDISRGVKLFILGANIWREFEEWPPSFSTKKLFLVSCKDKDNSQGKGFLKTKPAETGCIDYFQHNPVSPVPTLGGRTLDPCFPVAGPVNQSAVEGRNDNLIYETMPLPEDITIIGTVRAKILFSTEGESADVVVKLIDVYPDRNALQIIGSVQRVVVVPNRPKLVEIVLGSIAATFKQGHCIRVDIASSNFPHLNINYGIPEMDMPTNLRIYKQSVYTGGEDTSFIELPTVDSNFRSLC